MTRGNIQWNAKQIARMCENGSLEFENKAQRNFVWDKGRMSLLIDSMLRDYPIPPIYALKTEKTAETKKGKVSVFDCLDGKQRCMTIKKFRENGFYLEGLENEELNGRYYDDLDEELRDVFDSYSLTVYFFCDTEEGEELEIMARLNNGKTLTGVESARIKAKDEKVYTLANHRFFGYFTENRIKRYENEDIVLKLLLQIRGIFELSTKNVKEAYESTISDAENETITKALDYVTEAIADIPQGELRRVLSKANLLCILYTSLKTDLKASEYGELIKRFWESDYKEFGGYDASGYISYSEALESGIMKAVNVEKRNELFKYYIDIKRE